MQYLCIADVIASIVCTVFAFDLVACKADESDTQNRAVIGGTVMGQKWKEKSLVGLASAIVLK